MRNKKSTKLKFGGKERTFLFGMGFLGMFFENTSTTMETLEADIKSNPFKVFPELMFWSLAYGYLRTNLKPDFNQYDVADWIDDDGGIDGENVKKFMDSLGESLNTKLPNEKVVKKRAVGKSKR